MASDTPKYRRLPGTGFAVIRQASLWFAPDHLLYIHSLIYSEDYKRFYFRDIQAVVIRKTQAGRIYNAVFAGLALMSLIAALVSSSGILLFWYIATSFFLVLLVLNTLLGPTCITHLRTAVQIEEIRSLRRLRRARKLLARLAPLVAAAQGELAPAEIPARMTELAQSSIQPAPVAAPPTIEPVAPPPAEPSAAPPP